jgi:serine O-acetyltransferase
MTETAKRTSSTLRESIETILQRDPAARSRLEVLLCYPGLHALLLHRWAHACWLSGWHTLARCISHAGRWLTGIEIHPGASLGRRVFIDHGMGVVIGEMAEVGDDCTIYQGVTLGGTSLAKGAKRHPSLENGVIVGAHACVLGGFTVGAGARIGSGAIVTKPVPAGATAVGNPARIIMPKTEEQNNGTVGAFAAYGITHSDDPVNLALRSLIEGGSQQDAQITLLWETVEKLAAQLSAQHCLPSDNARKHPHFEAEKIKGSLGN